MHFMSFAQIAERLNRTLVLTNVGNSRIQACRKHPFGFYFDVEEFRHRFPNVRMITQSDFRQWTIDRKRKPETYWSWIQPRDTPFKVEYLKPYPKILKGKECLKQFKFVLNHKTVFKKIFLGVNFLWTQSEMDIAVTKFMLQQLNVTKEVLLLEHRLPKLLFKDPQKVPPIPYAKQLVQSAANVSDFIRPYVGIHWRMEQGDPKMMPKCARRLVKYLESLKERTSIERVYLATDYPLIGSKSHKAQSSTFRDLGPKHHEAFGILTKYLNESKRMHTWVSTNVLGYLPMDEGLMDEFRESGIQGIADKLMLINATWFVSGPKGCARTSSTFTKRIKDFRRRMLEGGNKKLWNIHERWH
ncbi:15338_t:CDS:1 [Acaulospora morrowiae]|uniref:15338_t:CDS:1 n=1 Tax=Acaulospora morrowiae TaxID=94023 RepID=A0A9N9CSM2_9GLOM|nr:15338_t:CDS:1 [Acaulospora morrowiae]